MKKKQRAVRRNHTKHQSGGSLATHANRIPSKPSSADFGHTVHKSIEQGESDPYDENLLERARTQWQFGDWESLVKLDLDALQRHPERAKLALLAATGHMQQGNSQTARQLTRLSQDWGCSKKLVSQILVAGVHNSLGRAAAIAGQQPRALKHFENAITLGTPGSEVRLMTQARIGEQLAQIGLQEGYVALQLTTNNGTAQTPPAGPPAPAFSGTLQNISEKLKAEVKADIKAEIYANNPNPYVHNRTMTPDWNKSLRDFAEKKLMREGLKATYIDYLAAKAVQIERNCTGRLATTVQDAVARQLVAECVPGDRLCILEIGALYGISLAILYNHAITRYLQVQVVCLDPFDGFYGKAIDAVLNNPVNDLTFRRNMQLGNVPQEDYRMIKYYSTDTAAIAAAKEIPINLLIIDGDHSYEGIKFDFDNYFPHLQPGGYVIFDDYNAKEWPGVQKFIDEELCKTQDLEYLGSVSRTAVARKKKV